MDEEVESGMKVGGIEGRWLTVARVWFEGCRLVVDGVSLGTLCKSSLALLDPRLEKGKGKVKGKGKEKIK